MLAEFSSVVDAVRCAIEVQRGMAERNAKVPQDKRIEFRMGINVGDIIIDGGDIFGDGVNVAARLEGLAEPGGIFRSILALIFLRQRGLCVRVPVAVPQRSMIAPPISVLRPKQEPSVGGPYRQDANGQYRHYCRAD